MLVFRGCNVGKYDGRFCCVSGGEKFVLDMLRDGIKFYEGSCAIIYSMLTAHNLFSDHVPSHSLSTCSHFLDSLSTSHGYLLYTPTFQPLSSTKFYTNIFERISSSSSYLEYISATKGPRIEFMTEPDRRARWSMGCRSARRSSQVSVLLEIYKRLTNVVVAS